MESAQPTAVLPPAAPFEVPPKKKAKGGKDDGAAKIAEMFGYTADNNPFGDANLTETFVWKKKIQKEVDTGVRTSAPTKTEQRAARDALVDEIERAKARRIAREKEKEEMERLRAEESRLRDAEQYAGWERQEEEFHRAQTAQRSLIRIREGREKPVDIIAKNALLVAQCESGQDLEEANKAVAGDVELHPPSSVYAQLPSHELEDLLVDAQAFADFEGQRGARAPFWNALRIVVTDELERARAREAGLAAGKSLGSLQAVEGEMDAMFEGKSEEQLRDMEQQVRGTIRGALEAAARPSSSAPSGPVVDVEYWERVLRHLQVAQARAALTRLHEETLLARLKQLEDRREVFAAAGITSRAVGAMAGAGAGEGFEAGGWEPDYGVAEGASASAAPAKPAKASAPAGSLSPELIPFDDRADRDAAAASGAPRAGGAYSPPLEPLEGHAVGQSLPAVELGPAATSAGAGASSFSSSSSAVDAAEDRKRLLQRRIALLRSSGVLPPEGGAGAAAGGAAPGGVPGAGEGLERTFTDDSGRVLPTGFGETDMGAAAEVAAAGGAAGSAAAPQPPAHMLMSPVELRAWQDKYRPRKPRFFNRIRTGYDWNRYNKSHYDYDNPPPKTVQGYKVSSGGPRRFKTAARLASDVSFLAHQPALPSLTPSPPLPAPHPDPHRSSTCFTRTWWTAAARRVTSWSPRTRTSTASSASPRAHRTRTSHSRS